MKTKVKNRARTLLTVNVEGSRPLYIKHKETVQLTEKDFSSPHVKALLREGMLTIVSEAPIVKKGIGVDARPILPVTKGKKPQGGDGT